MFFWDLSHSLSHSRSQRQTKLKGRAWFQSSSAGLNTKDTKTGSLGVWKRLRHISALVLDGNVGPPHFLYFTHWRLYNNFQEIFISEPNILYGPQRNTCEVTCADNRTVTWPIFGHCRGEAKASAGLSAPWNSVGLAGPSRELTGVPTWVGQSPDDFHNEDFTFQEPSDCGPDQFERRQLKEGELLLFI